MQITIPEEIIQQLFENNEEGMKGLITYFLNAVMKKEARIQSGALQRLPKNCVNGITGSLQDYISRPSAVRFYKNSPLILA